MSKPLLLILASALGCGGVSPAAPGDDTCSGKCDGLVADSYTVQRPEWIRCWVDTLNDNPTAACGVPTLEPVLTNQATFVQVVAQGEDPFPDRSYLNLGGTAGGYPVGDNAVLLNYLIDVWPHGTLSPESLSREFGGQIPFTIHNTVDNPSIGMAPFEYWRVKLTGSRDGTLVLDNYKVTLDAPATPKELNIEYALADIKRGQSRSFYVIVTPGTSSLTAKVFLTANGKQVGDFVPATLDGPGAYILDNGGLHKTN
jgi:hypothetical protein